MASYLHSLFSTISSASSLSTNKTTEESSLTTTTTATSSPTASSSSSPSSSSSSLLLNEDEEQKILAPLVDTLTNNKDTWKNASLLSVSQITPSGLSLLFQVASEMRTLRQTGGGGNDCCKHCILATIFYEASTRTACSFQAAMQRLGGTCIHVDSAKSSSQKGESLSDTIRCLHCYVDIAVLRHSTRGSVAKAISNNNNKPIINGGDGTGEHPTQALLDLYTICDELKLSIPYKEDGLKKKLVVVMVGDLKHGRTVHSLAKLLAKSTLPIQLRYCSPPSLEMPLCIQQEIAATSSLTQQESFSDLSQAIGTDANVLYVTRIQKERFENPMDYEKVKGSYVIDQDVMKRAPSDMIVMHPLPRVDEISTDVDEDPRAAYFRQMENGMYVRMAILALLLGKA